MHYYIISLFLCKWIIKITTEKYPIKKVDEEEIFTISLLLYMLLVLMMYINTTYFRTIFYPLYYNSIDIKSNILVLIIDVFGTVLLHDYDYNSLSVALIGPDLVSLSFIKRYDTMTCVIYTNIVLFLLFTIFIPHIICYIKKMHYNIEYIFIMSFSLVFITVLFPPYYL